jgi:DNA-directed RNA polymerase alpha subunit
MEHLLLSCLESRAEPDQSLYGRFLVGPFKVGQGTTIATALRRVLLSELRGVAITAVSIGGAAHEYASIEGVRESALDIVLNLKQIVLTGQPDTELPAMGHVSIHGPRIVKANDLRLPAGIRCVNGNQHLATLSSNGVLTMRLLISAGKGYIAHHPQTPQLSSRPSLQPRLYKEGVVTTPPARNAEADDMALSRTTPLRWCRSPLDLRHTRSLSTVPRRRLHVSGEVYDIVQYGHRRRLATSSPQQAYNPAPSQWGPGRSHMTPSPQEEGRISPEERSRGQTRQRGSEPTSRAEQTLQAVGAGAKVQPTQLFTKDGSIRGPRSEATLSPPPVDWGRGHVIAVPTPRLQGTLDQQALEQESPQAIAAAFGFSPKESANGPMLSIDAVFMPVTKVNFLVQTDDQWPEARERVIFEIWTNGSIHPRQAITESASLLVHLFSLFRQAGPLFSSSPLASPRSAKMSWGEAGGRRSLDIGNLPISVQAYTALKRAGIGTLPDLLIDRQRWSGGASPIDVAVASEVEGALMSLGIGGQSPLLH